MRNHLPRALTILLCALVAGVPAAAQQETNIVMVRVGDDSRSVQLYVPESRPADLPLPLVFNLHGSNSHAEQQELLSGMSAVADEHGFLLAGGMAAYEDAGGRRTWNADLDPDGPSDIDYIRAAIDVIDRKWPVDRRRVYVTGMSGGARMSSRVGCELAGTIAAIAPVAGLQFGADCAPSRPLPVITFHGLEDRVNTYATGNPERNPNWVEGVEPAVSRWVANNDCSEMPASESISNEVSRITYPDCEGGADVVFYRIANGGHTWPGSPIAEAVRERLGVTNMDVDGSRLIWEFFAAHPLP